MSLTSTQIGLLAENIVINAILIASEGRLVPFRPIADDYGIDLLIYDKVSGCSFPLQVKARTRTLRKKGGTERGNVVHFGVRKVALRDRGQTQLLAVLLDEGMSRIRALWLMPLPEVERLGGERKNVFVIRPSQSESSKDKFRSYCLRSADALVQRLLAQ